MVIFSDEWNMILGNCFSPSIMCKHIIDWQSFSGWQRWHALHSDTAQTIWQFYNIFSFSSTFLMALFSLSVQDLLVLIQCRGKRNHQDWFRKSGHRCGRNALVQQQDDLPFYTIYRHLFIFIENIYVPHINRMKFFIRFRVQWRVLRVTFFI